MGSLCSRFGLKRGRRSLERSRRVSRGFHEDVYIYISLSKRHAYLSSSRLLDSYFLLIKKKIVLGPAIDPDYVRTVHVLYIPPSMSYTPLSPHP